MKRLVVRRLAAVGATTAAIVTGLVISAGPALAWGTAIKLYPNTAAGWRSCQIDLKLAPSTYRCVEWTEGKVALWRPNN
ncbi:hypothetical protein ACFY19_03190 [Streptosporangium saharense]|uniref:hypothetical protein n=1 Tax=Streptosporangium saharense TaxID=1706840 RepID=UPI003674C55A